MIKLKDILKEESEFITEFKRPTLKYKLNSLNKYIDTKTMEEHFKVHFKKYTDNMNETIKEEGINITGIQELLRLSANYSPKLRNNAGGYYNHVIYFEQFTSEDTSPKELVKESIERDFGTIQNFKEVFTQAGLDVFGSGWVWLVSDGVGKLSIMTTQNQDNPFMWNDFGGKILIGMDVWEHAYYLKHQADRKAHIKDFFGVIDWGVVEERYKL